MKKLYLMRHAKSVWDDPQMLDHDRRITEQGKLHAEKVAQNLRELNVKLDGMICSDAVRARETAMIVAHGLGFPEQNIVVNPKLYEESVGELIEVIKAIPSQENSVMIVAHNPTLSWFATYLSNNSQVNLSTCGLFAMQFDMSSWEQITEIEGEVIKVC